MIALRPTVLNQLDIFRPTDGNSRRRPGEQYAGSQWKDREFSPPAGYLQRQPLFGSYNSHHGRLAYLSAVKANPESFGYNHPGRLVGNVGLEMQVPRSFGVG